MATLPVKGSMSTCYCTRWGAFHAGVDIAAPLGTPILAAASGRVADAGPESGFGNWVVIEHADGSYSVYGHMRTVLARTGDEVALGDVIALVGSEGFSTGPHLHFEVREGGIYGAATDPISWLSARGIDAAPWRPLS